MSAMMVVPALVIFVSGAVIGVIFMVAFAIRREDRAVTLSARPYKGAGPSTRATRALVGLGLVNGNRRS
jgi:hypothetical protein